ALLPCTTCSVLSLTFFSHVPLYHLSLPSFPTRRSSDLIYTVCACTAGLNFFGQLIHLLSSHPHITGGLNNHRITARGVQDFGFQLLVVIDKQCGSCRG